VGRDKRSKNACVGDACGDGLSSDAGVVACLEADALVGRDRRSKDSVAFDVIVVLEPDRGDIAAELKDAAPDSGVLTLLWIGDDLAAEAAVGRDKRSKNAGGGDARGGGGDGLSSGAGAVACFEADALVGRDRRPKDSAVYVVPDPSDEGVAAASLDAGVFAAADPLDKGVPHGDPHDEAFFADDARDDGDAPRGEGVVAAAAATRRDGLLRRVDRLVAAAAAGWGLGKVLLKI
jgi:hypothetical protein